MDQILFLIDLDQLLPLEGTLIDEITQEYRLSLVKQTCLRILLQSCQLGNIETSKRPVPFFGFRFYSSLGYFKPPEQLNVKFLELNLSNLDSFESELDDRFSYVISCSQREAAKRPDYFTAYKSQSKSASVEGLRQCLDEVLVLYEWDRPVLKSPLKQGKVGEDGSLGNSIFVLSCVPHTWEQLTHFLSSSQTTSSRNSAKPSIRELTDKLISKKSRNVLSGYLNISVHLVDTHSLHPAGVTQADTHVTNVRGQSTTPKKEQKEKVMGAFNKALKDVKGCVIPLESITNITGCFTFAYCDDADDSSLLSSARNYQQDVPLLTPSIVMKSLMGHSKLTTARHAERKPQLLTLMVSDRRLEMETQVDDMHEALFVNNLGELTLLRLVRANLFPSQTVRVARNFCVWPPSHTKAHDDSSVTGATLLRGLLCHLHVSGLLCLLEQTVPGPQLIVLRPLSVESGMLQILDEMDSHIYRRLLGLHGDAICLPELEKSLPAKSLQLCNKFKTKAFAARKKKDKGPAPSFDVTLLESWRVPDNYSATASKLCESLAASSESMAKTKLSMMKSVRDLYASERGGKALKRKLDMADSSGLTSIRPCDDEESSLRGDGEGRKLIKHSSGMSIDSYNSKSSGRSSHAPVSHGTTRASARWASIQRLNGRTKKSGSLQRLSSDSSSFTPQSGVSTRPDSTMVNAKAQKGSEYLESFLANPGVQVETSELINFLNSKMDALIRSENVEGLEMAGFVEACVSSILKHIECRRIPTDKFEEVAKGLLVDYRSGMSADVEDYVRINHDKIQALLRCEMHWLLVNAKTSSEYESAIICHFGRIGLFAKQEEMLEFLEKVVTPCYVIRQPEMVHYIYQELQIDLPEELMQIFSPRVEPTSIAPSSNNSHNSSQSQFSQPQAAPCQNPRSRRALSKHPSRTSFDTSNLSRQIKITSNVAADVANKGNNKRAVPAHQQNKRRRGGSAKKPVVSSALHKSPRKQQARRNLCFDKSPRKKPSTTPVKDKRLSRLTPVKLTPGKRHRVIIPATPSNKQQKRKSDGNRSIAETPDKSLANEARESIFSAGHSLRRNMDFYSGARSRNVTRYEEIQKANLLSKSVSFDNIAMSQLQSGAVNTSQSLFPHLLANRKRKRRQSSLSQDENGGNEGDDFDMGHLKSPQAKQSRRDRRSMDSDFDASGSFECELVSPSKRLVTFNTRPLPPTPKRSLLQPEKSILKTPSKTTPAKAVQNGDWDSSAANALSARRTPGKQAGLTEEHGRQGIAIRHPTVKLPNISVPHVQARLHHTPSRRSAADKDVLNTPPFKQANEDAIGTPDKLITIDYNAPPSPVFSSAKKKKNVSPVNNSKECDSDQSTLPLASEGNSVDRLSEESLGFGMSSHRRPARPSAESLMGDLKSQAIRDGKLRGRSTRRSAQTSEEALFEPKFASTSKDLAEMIEESKHQVDPAILGADDETIPLNVGDRLSADFVMLSPQDLPTLVYEEETLQPVTVISPTKSKTRRGRSLIDSNPTGLTPTKLDLGDSHILEIVSPVKGDNRSGFAGRGASRRVSFDEQANSNLFSSQSSLVIQQEQNVQENRDKTKGQKPKGKSRRNLGFGQTKGSEKRRSSLASPELDDRLAAKQEAEMSSSAEDSTLCASDRTRRNRKRDSGRAVNETASLKEEGQDKVERNEDGLEDEFRHTPVSQKSRELAGLRDLLTNYYSPSTSGRRRSHVNPGDNGDSSAAMEQFETDRGQETEPSTSRPLPVFSGVEHSTVAVEPLDELSSIVTPNRRTDRQRPAVNYEEIDIDSLSTSGSPEVTVYKSKRSGKGRKKCTRNVRQDDKRVGQKGNKKAAEENDVASTDSQEERKIVKVTTLARKSDEDEIKIRDVVAGRRNIRRESIVSQPPSGQGEPNYTVAKTTDENGAIKIVVNISHALKAGEANDLSAADRKATQKQVDPAGPQGILSDRTNAENAVTPIKTKKKKKSKKSTPYSENGFVQRFSRSATKEVGISPSKLHLMVVSSPYKKELAELDASTSNPQSPLCQENRSQEEDTELPAPRIHLRKVPSKNGGSSQDGPSVTSDYLWQSEIREVKRGERDHKLTFSPLSASSIHKLSTSPLLENKVKRSDDQDSKNKKSKKLLRLCK